MNINIQFFFLLKKYNFHSHGIRQPEEVMRMYSLMDNPRSIFTYD